MQIILDSAATATGSDGAFMDVDRRDWGALVLLLAGASGAAGVSPGGDDPGERGGRMGSANVQMRINQAIVFFPGNGGNGGDGGNLALITSGDGGNGGNSSEDFPVGGEVRIVYKFSPGFSAVGPVDSPDIHVKATLRGLIDVPNALQQNDEVFGSGGVGGAAGRGRGFSDAGTAGLGGDGIDVSVVAIPIVANTRSLLDRTSITSGGGGQGGQGGRARRNPTDGGDGGDGGAVSFEKCTKAGIDVRLGLGGPGGLPGIVNGPQRGQRGATGDVGTESSN